MHWISGAPDLPVASLHDAILPVFCPTSQSHFG